MIILMYKLKPLKAIQNCIFSLALPFLLLTNLILIFSPDLDPWVQRVFLLNDLHFIIAYLLGRLLYPVRYTIDKEGVTVYDRKRLVLKLKREQISKVYVRKERWSGFFRCLYGMVICYAIHPHCTSISFCFSESEICHQRICSIQRKRLMTSLDFKNELCEFNDFFTYRQCMKICKILGIEPIFVE